eukprot:3196428-Rhodomonas_salina.1
MLRCPPTPRWGPDLLCPKSSQQSSQVDHFLAAHRRCDILGLCRAECNAIFAFRLPGDGHVVQAEHVACDRLERVWIRHVVGIHPALQPVSLYSSWVAVNQALLESASEVLEHMLCSRQMDLARQLDKLA